VDRSVPRLDAARVAKCEVQLWWPNSSRNSRTPTFGVYGVGELVLMPALVAHLQSTEADDGGTIDRSPDVPVLPAPIPCSERLADEARGVLDRVRPPGLFPTSDLGWMPTRGLRPSPRLGRDGAERDLLHHNIQRSCRRTTSLARLGLASRPPTGTGP
jgi:hypothetical protein